MYRFFDTKPPLNNFKNTLTITCSVAKKGDNKSKSIQNVLRVQPLFPLSLHEQDINIKVYLGHHSSAVSVHMQSNFNIYAFISGIFARLFPSVSKC